MSLFKKYDIIDELDKKISKEENVFVESMPNKIPFIIKYIRPYLLLEASVIFIDFLFGVIRPAELNVFIEAFEIFLIALNCVPLFLIFKALYKTIMIVNNSYYVITDKGIHTIKGGQSLDYNLVLYEDMKSIILNKYKHTKDRGDIIIKDSTTREPKKLSDKFFFVHNGLLAIDDVRKVYDILKQIAIQENPEIFFSDDTNDLKVDYFKDVKKYNKKINVDKDDSIIKRRS